jgi:hypothetical protein
MKKKLNSNMKSFTSIEDINQYVHELKNVLNII